MPWAVTDLARHPPQIVAECCRLAAPPLRHRQPSRDREIGGTALLVLAGRANREEDRLPSKFPKKYQEATPCRAKLRSIRCCARNATPAKFPASWPWLRPE